MYLQEMKKLLKLPDPEIHTPLPPESQWWWRFSMEMVVAINSSRVNRLVPGSSVKAKSSTTTVTTTGKFFFRYYTSGQCKTSTTTTTKETTTIDVKGASLQGFKGGMEESMVNFLNSGKICYY